MSTPSLNKTTHWVKNVSVRYFAKKLNSVLEAKSMTGYQLALEAKMDTGQLYKILNGKMPPSDNILKKLASVDVLGLDEETMRVWRLVDKYPEETLKLAYEELERREPK